MNLIDEFGRIKRDHDLARRRTAARVVLGPSVMRVYRSGTTDKLSSTLAGLPVQEVLGLGKESEFRSWFESNLEIVADAIKKSNAGNSKVFPGYKWGHGTKITCLYLREILVYQRVASDSDLARIGPWFYVPVDSIVMNRLRTCGYQVAFKAIREIDTPKKFYDIQESLGDAAAKVGVPRLWFDDNWGDRR